MFLCVENGAWPSVVVSSLSDVTLVPAVTIDGSVAAMDAAAAAAALKAKASL